MQRIKPIALNLLRLLHVPPFLMLFFNVGTGMGMGLASFFPEAARIVWVVSAVLSLAALVVGFCKYGRQAGEKSRHG